MSFKIKETQDIKGFAAFPYNLYLKNPFWVGELKNDVVKLLSPSHPFWFHAEKKLFMAFDGEGQAIGRIAAIVNHSHNSFHNEKCGFFGFFDCIDNTEVSGALLCAAENWLKSRGMDMLRGPANPSSNETWGMLVEGFDSPNMVMMPYNFSYYKDLVEKAGYCKEKDLLAFKFLTSKGFPQRFRKITDRVVRDGSVKINLVDIDKIDSELEKLKDIYNKAWEKNWGFVPMTQAEIEHMASDLKPFLKSDYLFFASVKGDPAAFCLLLPDFNIPLKSAHGKLTPFNIPIFLWRMFFSLKSGRLLALGVKSEYRNRGLELLMIKQAIESASRMGWEWGELSWTLEDNEKINSVISNIGGVVYKKYRIYSKKL
ncbi:MAG: GNAT family N-acetyltransferase [Elusimicrobiota bacterium]